MKEIIQMIAQALVDRPEAVNVEVVDGNYTSILRVSVGRGEAGKIIGKKGRTADALRIILNAIAAKEQKRIVLEIQDDFTWSKRVAEIPEPIPLLRRRSGAGMNG